MKHGTGEIQFDYGKSMKIRVHLQLKGLTHGKRRRRESHWISAHPKCSTGHPGSVLIIWSTQLVMIFILTVWTKWLILQCCDNAVLFLLHVSTRKSRTPQWDIYHYIIVYHYTIIRSMKHNSTSSQQKCPEDSLHRFFPPFPTSTRRKSSTSKAASCSMTWNRPRPSPWKNSMGKHDGRSTDFFWKYWGNNQQ